MVLMSSASLLSLVSSNSFLWFLLRLTELISVLFWLLPWHKSWKHFERLMETETSPFTISYNVPDGFFVRFIWLCVCGCVCVCVCGCCGCGWSLLYSAILRSRADSLGSCRTRFSMSVAFFLSFLNHVFEYPLNWCTQHYLVVTWVMPRETAAVSTHVMCTPYNHAPVCSVTSFQAS